MENYKVGCSPLTSEIYAGSVSKTGLWGKKHNVTDTAVGAVAQHLLQKDEEMEFQYRGKKYALRVVEIHETFESE
jgi:hypothetical protein